MSNKDFDISDDEIRVIGSSTSKPVRPQHTNKWLWWLIAACIALIAGVALMLLLGKEKYNEPTTQIAHALATQSTNRGVSIADTTINGAHLTILTPSGAIPSLQVGAEASSYTTALLVMRAADVRADNGGIVGAFVDKGELVSRGESKAGFCAIINGEITIGVADATPLLEQAIETEGYFFRQYPLVVAGQVVENKPAGKSHRNALAELGGHVCVISSDTDLTFHDFSQALTDLGVSNAIYLPGSTSYGFARRSDGTLYEIGRKGNDFGPGTSFIVWK